MNVRHSMGVLRSFAIRNTFFDQVDLRLFLFPETISYISISLTYVLPNHVYSTISVFNIVF